MNSSTALPPNCELQLSFDRAKAEQSLIEIGTVIKSVNNTALKLSDVYLTAEYISSPQLRKSLEQWESKALCIQYDEIDVTCKTLPLNQATIRVDNIRGGLTPSYMFVGIIKTDSLSGSVSESSSGFYLNGIEEFNITLNGSSVHGYPIKIKYGYPIIPYIKFQK